MSADGKIRYRVRVKGDDGKELVSSPFDGPAPDHSGKLGEPRWSSAHFGHGDNAGMEVDVQGLEGRKILFIVEHNHSGSWEKYKELQASVKGGKARAQLQLHHAKKTGAASDADIEPADVRFHVELAD